MAEFSLKFPRPEYVGMPLGVLHNYLKEADIYIPDDALFFVLKEYLYSMSFTDEGKINVVKIKQMKGGEYAN